jgi:tetratricopeptide (TPR) repeat protein
MRVAMPADVLQIVGGIAGIGGISLGVLLLLYRDIISRKIFPTLSSFHATVLLASMIFFIFVIALLGIFAGLAGGAGAVQYIVLVAIVLVFLVVVLLVAKRILSERRSSEPARSPQEQVFHRVHTMIAKNQLAEADQELSQSGRIHRNNAESWYWRARVAAARGNVDVAIRYIDESLKKNGMSEYGVALKIKLLLLSSKRGDRAKAKDAAKRARGISSSLDTWLTCLEAEGMLEPGIRSNTELDTKCPLPDPVEARPKTH